MATRGPVNGKDSPGILKWTEVGGAENIIHEGWVMLYIFFVLRFAMKTYTIFIKNEKCL